MTIAAGFRFDAGIILCADSEESTGTSIKVSVPKIEVIDKKWSKLVLTGAGDADMLNRAFEEISESVGPRFSHDAIRGAIEQVVSDLYNQYVYPTPGEDKPYFELLVGYHTAKGADFIKISRRATVRPKQHEVIGYGILQAAQLMDRWYRPAMSEDEAILLAVYLLQQTKRYVPYCGGPSRICILRPDGKVEWVSSARVTVEENYADEFDETIRDPFFACANRGVTDADFEDLAESVQASWTVLRILNRVRPPIKLTEEAPASAPHRKAAEDLVMPGPSAPPTKRKVVARVLRGSKRGR